jgi:hypothetical protein
MKKPATTARYEGGSAVMAMAVARENTSED